VHIRLRYRIAFSPSNRTREVYPYFAGNLHPSSYPLSIEESKNPYCRRLLSTPEHVLREPFQTPSAPYLLVLLHVRNTTTGASPFIPNMDISYCLLDQNRQEIRLLRQSSDSIRGGRLDYELIYYTFDEKHLYFALSYVWGQQELQKTISVDGKTVPVSANLWAALRLLYDTSRAATDEEELSPDVWRRLGLEDHIAKVVQSILQDELVLEI
jgi:hypothetical protein